MHFAQDNCIRAHVAGSDMPDLFRRELLTPLGDSPEKLQRHMFSFMRHTVVNVKPRRLDL